MNNGSGVSVSSWVTTLVCLLLQVLLAPHISIAGTPPLFLLVALITVASGCDMVTGVLFGFLLGLLYDLGSGEPLGVMALAFSLVAGACQLAGRGEGSTGPGPVFAIAAVVLTELLQAVLMTVTGFTDSFGYVFVHRVLIGSLYTGAVTLVGLGIVRAVVSRASASSAGGLSRRLR